MVIAGQLGQRAALDQFPIAPHARFEALARHAFGGADGGDGVGREGQVERTVLAAQEASRGKGLQLLRLADSFQSLANVDEAWDGRIVRPAYAGDPGAEVRTGD